MNLSRFHRPDYPGLAAIQAEMQIVNAAVNALRGSKYVLTVSHHGQTRHYELWTRKPYERVCRVKRADLERIVAEHRREAA
jgi:hypothetical protein